MREITDYKAYLKAVSMGERVAYRAPDGVVADHSSWRELEQARPRTRKAPRPWDERWV